MLNNTKSIIEQLWKLFYESLKLCTLSILMYRKQYCDQICPKISCIDIYATVLNPPAAILNLYIYVHLFVFVFIWLLRFENFVY